MVIEKKQHKAAERRAKHPKLKLPFNPTNPFDSPVPTMPPPPRPEGDMSSTVAPIARRHLRQESADEVERAAHEERIKNIEERLEDSRQRTGDEEELEKQLQREISSFERRFAK